MTPTAEQALEALNTLSDAAVEILWTEKCLELTKLVRQHIEATAAEVEALRKENVRLIEDRARFPDRPDDIGRMIGAHYNNLRAQVRAAEDAWNHARIHAERWSRDAGRYQWWRDNACSDPCTVAKLLATLAYPDQIDAAIDAALNQGGAG